MSDKMSGSAKLAISLAGVALLVYFSGVWYPNAEGASSMPLWALGLLGLAVLVMVISYIDKSGVLVAPGAGAAAGSAIRGWIASGSRWIASSIAAHPLRWTWVGITFAGWVYFYGLSLVHLGSRSYDGWWSLVIGAILASGIVFVLYLRETKVTIAAVACAFVFFFLLFGAQWHWYWAMLMTLPVGLLIMWPKWIPVWIKLTMALLVAIVIVFTVVFNLAAS